MLTFFTTAKPFVGHINVIQRNALKSWMLLHPDVEVIVFGDDEGTTEIAREFGFRHEPDVERTQFGAIRLDSMFRKAQMIARHEVLCYANCDIILLSDFCAALERVRNKYRQFLMVGRRWDTPITEPVDFSDPRWDESIARFAVSTNNRRDEWWIDYFAFSRGLYGSDIPPLGIGRGFWDDWLMWRGLHSKYPVVDASRVVVAVHQNHDYSHHPKGTKGVREGEETKQNLMTCGGWNHMRSISDATFVLSPRGFARNSHRYWRALTKPWWLQRDRNEFQLRTPGRFRYFVHRCWSNLVFGSTMTRADLSYSWAHTLFELVVGRERSHYLEGVRTRVRRLFRYVGRRFRTAEQGNTCP